MTERIDCSNCGFTLYFGESIRHRYIMKYSEEKVLEWYGNKCPNCGAQLTLQSVKIEDRTLGR